MTDASWFQNDFSGGEVSPDAQGNFDDPMYGKSLALCRNSYILPSKSAERRQGTRQLGIIGRTPGAVIRSASLNDGTPLLIEIQNSQDTSPGVLLWAAPGLMGVPLPAFTYDYVNSPITPVLDQIIEVSSISSDIPAVFTLATTPSPAWASGDRISFYVDDPHPATASILRNTLCTVTMLTTTTFTTGGLAADSPAFNGANIVNRTTYDTIYAAHHLQFPGPTIQAYVPYGVPSGLATTFYGAQDVQIVPADNNKIYFLYPKLPPWVMDLSNLAVPTFQDAASNWWDGPWCDPPTGTSQTGNFPLTITANTGATITLEYLTGANYIPEIVGFAQSIRLWTQPAAWASGTAYTTTQVVTYAGEYYTNVINDTGTIPGTSNVTTGLYPWVLTPTLGVWANGFLVAKTAGPPKTMTFQIVSDQQIPSYSPANVIETYQVGLYFFHYSDITGTYQFDGRGPLDGAWHQGRLWLAGAGADLVTSYPAALGTPTQFGYNRFDASAANEETTVGGAIPTLSTTVPVVTVPGFSPTDNNGNVLDNSGISYSLNSNTSETIHWILPDAQGLLVGTNTDEWLITASALNDPITPTSIQAQRQTRIGSNTVPPLLTGISVLFVQTLGKRVVEYVADVLSQRFTPQELNDRALHICGNASIAPQSDAWVPGRIIAIGYQKQPYPFVWVASQDGSLAACTYRRLSRFGQEPPVLNAWHSHTLGDAGGLGVGGVGTGGIGGGSTGGGTGGANGTGTGGSIASRAVASIAVLPGSPSNIAIYGID